MVWADIVHDAVRTFAALHVLMVFEIISYFRK